MHLTLKVSRWLFLHATCSDFSLIAQMLGKGLENKLVVI
jgi:hypothetical protein